MDLNLFIFIIFLSIFSLSLFTFCVLYCITIRNVNADTRALPTPLTSYFFLFTSFSFSKLISICLFSSLSLSPHASVHLFLLQILFPLAALFIFSFVQLVDLSLYILLSCSVSSFYVPLSCRIDDDDAAAAASAI